MHTNHQVGFSIVRRMLPGVTLLLAGSLLRAAQPASNADSATPTNTWNVRAYGARGDGHTKDTAAVQKAIDACAANGGGTVLVPPGDYLIGSVVISSNTTLRLESRANLCGSPDITDYPLVRVRWEGEFREGHRALIASENANNIAIVGRGSILGPPLSLSRLRNPRGPALIELSGGTNVLLEGFSTQYQQLWSIHLLYCQNLAARNLTIRSINVNGDGIDLDSCRDATIENCDIDTGDDAIALKSGRGMEAVRIGRPTENVLIRNCTLVSSMFAGLAIGTEMSGGIRNVRIEDCLISGRQNGIFIKSRDGRGGFIENITGNNLLVRHSPTFLGINLLNKGIQASEPVPGKIEQWPRVGNIRFENIKVDQVGELVAAKNIPADRPVDGLTLTDITGTCRQGIALANMVNVKLEGIDFTGYRGPLISTENVKGSGLENPSTTPALARPGWK